MVRESPDKPLTLAEKRDRISCSIGRYIMARYDPATPAIDAWADWADAEGIAKTKAERARREFTEAWNGRPAELEDIRALAEMGEDE